MPWLPPCYSLYLPPNSHPIHKLQHFSLLLFRNKEAHSPLPNLCSVVTPDITEGPNKLPRLNQCWPRDEVSCPPYYTVSLAHNPNLYAYLIHMSKLIFLNNIHIPTGNPKYVVLDIHPRSGLFLKPIVKCPVFTYIHLNSLLSLKTLL